MGAEKLEEVTDLRRDGRSVFALAFARELIDHYWWFLISVPAGILIGFVFLRYATPQYVAKASLLISDDSRGGRLEDFALLENLGIPGVGSSSVDNEIEILKSKGLIERVVDSLQLYITCIASGRVKTAELYDRSPFKIRFLGNQVPAPGRYCFVLVGKKRFRLSEGQHEINGRFGDTIQVGRNEAVITKTDFEWSEEDQYCIAILDREEVLRKYRAGIVVSSANKFTSVIHLLVRDNIPGKAKAILQSLIGQYLANNIRDRNQVADHTIAFISRNLNGILEDLRNVEDSIARFRSGNAMINPELEAQTLTASSETISAELAKCDLQLQIIGSLTGLTSEKHISPLPANLLREDSGVADLIRIYNELMIRRTRLAVTLPDQNPLLIAADKQILQARNELSQKIARNEAELKARKKFLEDQQRTAATQIRKLPEKDRAYLNLAREQQIKQDLYVFLLRKAMETSISRSATVANARVIDFPEAEMIPVSPDRGIVLLVSAFAGASIPVLLLHLRKIFNEKITDRRQIEDRCSAPVIGEIGFENALKNKLLTQESRNLVTEQFRTLRTNLLFASGNKPVKTILITSGISGEGKSFVAANLAKSLALSGKRTLLLELDLRQPSLSKYLNAAHAGIADYLAGSLSGDKLIQKITGHAFDIIAAGTPPANPLELLSTTKFEMLLKDLQRRYDHVVLDTPPIGLVSDAHMLGEFSDMSLYVIRRKVSGMHQLHEINKLFRDQRLPALHLVFNGSTHPARYSYYQTHTSTTKNPFVKLKQRFRV